VVEVDCVTYSRSHEHYLPPLPKSLMRFLGLKKSEVFFNRVRVYALEVSPVICSITHFKNLILRQRHKISLRTDPLVQRLVVISNAFFMKRYFMCCSSSELEI